MPVSKSGDRAANPPARQAVQQRAARRIVDSLHRAPVVGELRSKAHSVRRQASFAGPLSRICAAGWRDGRADGPPSQLRRGLRRRPSSTRADRPCGTIRERSPGRAAPSRRDCREEAALSRQPDQRGALLRRCGRVRSRRGRLQALPGRQARARGRLGRFVVPNEGGSRNVAFSWSEAWSSDLRCPPELEERPRSPRSSMRCRRTATLRATPPESVDRPRSPDHRPGSCHHRPRNRRRSFGCRDSAHR